MNEQSSAPVLNYLIAGQGLAGTILAHQLHRRGKKFLLIDDPSLTNSSKVAAGLFNPVVFKRLVKSWMAEEQLSFAEKFYPEMEKILGAKFFYRKELVKIFSEEQEKILWEQKRAGEIGQYLSPINNDPLLQDGIPTPEGFAFVKKAGYLDIPVFLNLSKKYFKEKNLLLEEKFDHSLLKIASGQITYRSILSRQIIFCEGHLASKNPWFSWMPFNLAKGEVLTIKIPGYNLEQVINKGVFILPIGSGLFRVGSTFSWDQLDESPTEKGKAELVQKLKKLLKLPFEIVDHKAGIRPTVINRRPLIGIHPSFPELAVFNGMGSKGVMIAPYFANHFIDHLENQELLNPEVDIRRFWKTEKVRDL